MSDTGSGRQPIVVNLTMTGYQPPEAESVQQAQLAQLAKGLCLCGSEAGGGSGGECRCTTKSGSGGAVALAEI